MNEALDIRVQYLKGVGEKRAKLFEKLGLHTCRDVLQNYPRAYEDRTQIRQISELVAGDSVCVEAMVASPVTSSYIREGMTVYKTNAVDESGSLSIVFFNTPHVVGALRQGGEYIFYGKVNRNNHNCPEMMNPVFESVEKKGHLTCRIVPVYRLTAQLPAWLMRSVTEQALEKALDSLRETLPADLRQKYELCGIAYATQTVHNPPNPEALEIARRRLVFDELLALSLALSSIRKEECRDTGPVFADTELEAFISALPFSLTNAQRRCMAELAADLSGGALMRRLVQGDVGSGKTVVAAAGAYLAAKNGMQCALMAPTELLAEQHARGITPLMEKLGVRTVLLTGATRSKAKLYKAIREGEADLIIGTHALISEAVEYCRLGLVITDEQHRFGVKQRAALIEKGGQAHMLVMSATPIPRTLSLLMYGDLELSVIDELPPGRRKVRTYVVDESYRVKIEAFIRKLVAQGRQVYIVCPRVDEHEDENMKAAKEYYSRLKETVFPDLRVGLVYGKLREKEKVMREFAGGSIDILVATTVIEVGVDTPNAALMVIENAERYGLSQLHQLRGRVGRGAHESYCVMFLQSGGQTARERLAVLVSTQDGFAIAEADLAQRGPGDFFGSRQHGLPSFKLADLSYDSRVLYEAKQAAEELLPRLSEIGYIRDSVTEIKSALGSMLQ